MARAVRAPPPREIPGVRNDMEVMIQTLSNASIPRTKDSRPEQQEVKGAVASSFGSDIDSVVTCGFEGECERHARA
ncbi:hypothetical protein ALC60_02658 [Trachymyrmex zeteki]|uniref:Uncharacterized protein n=1 Tax=Mycetomoellerius zeteki TaxID=64791 RepID=A0A151XD90_9HYME|nr:hypothetical protein ALC60_02658 [Trachymyrmex zeteki]